MLSAGPTAREVAAAFNRRFAIGARTVIAGGAPEPAYYPAPPGAHTGRALIRYREDFVASALHEIAHWCVAGAARRARLDYGYWYEPPPRSAVKQAAFYAAEVRVQALEKWFATACGLPFRVSADQLGEVDLDAFAALVATRTASLGADTVPGRARAFHTELALLAPRASVTTGPTP